MAIKKIKKYVASDGQDFPIKEDAERHDSLVEAEQKYREARDRFKFVLAKTQKTADGELFDFGAFRTYYYICPYLNGLPVLKEISFLGFNFEIDDRDEFKISKERDPDGRLQWVAISELYCYRLEAEKVLLKAQEEQLACFAREVKRLRKKIKSQEKNSYI